MNAGSDKEDIAEKKIKIQVLLKTEDDRLKLSEITLVDTKTIYNRILKENNKQKKPT